MGYFNQYTENDKLPPWENTDLLWLVPISLPFHEISIGSKQQKALLINLNNRFIGMIVGSSWNNKEGWRQGTLPPSAIVNLELYHLCVLALFLLKLEPEMKAYEQGGIFEK